MYVDFTLLFIFIGLGFISWLSGVRLFVMIAFWGSIFYALINYSFGYVILTAIEFAIGGFIGWLVTGERRPS